MTYQVLARKYRPQNFQEIVGQEHVVQALVNGLENDRLHHAFLFTGTRGVGKTTLARVLAKALNCLEGVSGNPCGVCQHCQEIKDGEFIDLIEVDAASRTGVDDTRSLLENVQYAANKGQYKIYLIDEVHMFSKSSFNALLKTLEEPPEHVKFLLATTEPDKLPVTVLSRCLQFNLKRLTQKQIADHLVNLLNKENVAHDMQAINLIARVADGSMRDALSLLDQSLAFGAGKVDYAEIRGMLGTIEQSHVTELLKLINSGDAEAVVEKLEWLHDMSVDYEQLLEDSCLLLHEIALLQSLGRVTGGSDFDIQQLKQLATEVAAETVQWYYQLVVVALEQIKFTPSKKVSFETAVIRMLSFQHDGNDTKKKPEISQSESKVITSAGQQADETTAAEATTQPAVQAAQQPEAHTPTPTVVAAPVVTPSIDLGQLDRDNWPTTFQSMRLKGIARELARNLELLENKNNVITFAVDESAKNFMTSKAQDAITHELVGGSDGYQVLFKLATEVDSLARQSAKQEQQKTEEAQILDPVVNGLQEQFGATIIQNKLGD